MQQGRFNTNTNALKQRILAHKKYAAYDLNQWIFNHLDIKKGFLVLDIGCGTGSQTLPMAKLVGKSGLIIAVDISKDALNILSDQARQVKLDSRITLFQADIDKLYQLEHPFFEYQFDRILACYSLYYAKNPFNVFQFLYKVMKPRGVLFFCGPAKNNNLELKRFHYSLVNQKAPLKSEAALFMEKRGQKLASEFFAKIEIFTFHNPLRFDSPLALHSYWSSYNLYNEKLDAEFKSASYKYFQNHSIFETVKRVIGIRAVKL